MAHEYNHVLQFAYDSQVSLGRDLWMYEAAATWAEDYVYPAIDDYLGYVPAFAATPEISLTRNGGGGLRIYGAAVWNHYLSSVHGDDVVREAWSVADEVFPAHLSVAAYDSALGGSGTNPFETLGDEFIGFASSTAEWRALPSLYPDAAEHPGMDRAGTLGFREPRRVRLDHLGYALFKVPEGAAARTLRLTVRAPNGTHFGLDLVGREGSPTGGTVSSAPISDDDGGRSAAILSAADYDRVTAVVANLDPRIDGSAAYARDDQRLTVKLSRP